MKIIVEFENDKMYACVMEYLPKPNPDIKTWYGYRPSKKPLTKVKYSVFYGPNSHSHLNEIDGFSSEKLAVKHLKSLIAILPNIEIKAKQK
jgi:hypothetical protein